MTLLPLGAPALEQELPHALGLGRQCITNETAPLVWFATRAWFCPCPLGRRLERTLERRIALARREAGGRGWNAVGRPCARIRSLDRLRRKQSEAHQRHRQLRAIAHAQPSESLGQVLLDGVLGEAESARDLL